jgi:UDP-N-acetylmuramyl pentapeptide phosphotransferase/UDP-N-acetylglucosamine-1-phosphate transferase
MTWPIQPNVIDLVVLMAVFCGSVVTLKVALASGIASRIAMDEPNHRSLHVIPTPRGAGMLFLPWIIAAGLIGGGDPLVLLLAAALMFVSLVDDRVGLPVVLRLGVHFLIAFSISFTAMVEGWFTVLVATLSIAWLMNLFNFMDGSDGLAGAMTVFGFGAYAWVASAAGQPELAIVSGAVAAGALAVLFFNFPPAKIFLGDSGSIPIGFLAGVLGLIGWRNDTWPVWFPVLVFSPFIVDATFTLLRRIIRRDRFWEAHREHAYQRLVRMGWSHGRLLGTEIVLMAGAAATAIALLHAPGVAKAGALVVWLGVYLVLLILIERQWQAYLVRTASK